MSCPSLETNNNISLRSIIDINGGEKSTYHVTLSINPCHTILERVIHGHYRIVKILCDAHSNIGKGVFESRSVDDLCQVWDKQAMLNTIAELDVDEHGSFAYNDLHYLPSIINHHISMSNRSINALNIPSTSSSVFTPPCLFTPPSFIYHYQVLQRVMDIDGVDSDLPTNNRCHTILKTESSIDHTSIVYYFIHRSVRWWLYAAWTNDYNILLIMVHIIDNNG